MAGMFLVRIVRLWLVWPLLMLFPWARLGLWLRCCVRLWKCDVRWVPRAGRGGRGRFAIAAWACGFADPC